MGSIVSGVADLFGLGPASIQANASRDAAQTSAAAQMQAAQLAAEAQKFRPVGVTSRFGSSQFEMTPEGYLKSAGYTLSPELQAIQDYVMGQTRTGLGDIGTLQAMGRNYLGMTQGTPVQALGEQYMASTAGSPLTSLGSSYLSASPEQAAADWMAKQQAVLQPGRERALSGVRNNLFQTGRTGLSTAQGGQLGAANPELQAYYNALAQQDAQLAAEAAAQGRAQQQFGAGLLQAGTGLTQAQQLAGAQLYGTGLGLTQQGIGFGQGLLSSAYAPLQTGLGLGATIEQLGQQPLDIGAQLGGRSATAGANVGQSLMAGGLGAAKTLQAANQYSPLAAGLYGLSQSRLGSAADQSLIDWTKGLFGGGGGVNLGDTSGLDAMSSLWY